MSNETLNGMVAIVTGGGRGIGREIALAFAKAGAKVTITAAREMKEIEQTAREIENAAGAGSVHFTLADVTNEDDCLKVRDETLSSFGGLHILVNNAARGHKYIHDANPDQPMDFWNADTAAWKLIVDTNINGPFLMAKAVTPHMLAQGFGRIINIGATENTMQKARNAPYGVSKCAMESETLIWAQDLAGTGKNITCNSLAPGGATLTGMVYEPVGTRKLNDPAIMGPPAVWLASRQSDGVNGRRIIARDWDTSLPPDQAAKRAFGGPAITPPTDTATATRR